jgi:hypothetical protein
MKITLNVVLLVVVILLAFYYTCGGKSQCGCSEPYNNLKMMLINSTGSPRQFNYDTRLGAGSANQASRDTLTGGVGVNGDESVVRGVITPTDLSYEMYGIPSGVTKRGCDIDIYNLNEVKWQKSMGGARDGNYQFGDDADPVGWDKRRAVESRSARMTPELLANAPAYDFGGSDVSASPSVRGKEMFQRCAR